MPSLTANGMSGERGGREATSRNSIRSLIRSISPFRFDAFGFKGQKRHSNKNKDGLGVDSCSTAASRKSSPDLHRHRRSASLSKHSHRPPKVPASPKPMRSSSRSSMVNASQSDADMAIGPSKNSIYRTRSAPIAAHDPPKLSEYKPTSEDLTEEDLTCPICLELMYRPRQLLCGHTFCILCLQNCVNSFCAKFVCPSCRSSTILPPNGVSSLPRNKVFENAINSIRRHKKRNSSTCQKCSMESTVTICAHCGKELCSSCGDVHKEELEEELHGMKVYLKETITSMPCMRKAEANRFVKLEEEIEEAVQTQIKSLRTKGEELQVKVRELRDGRNDTINTLSQDIQLIYSRIDHMHDDKNWQAIGKMYSDFNSLTSAALLEEPRVVLDKDALSLTTQSSMRARSARRTQSLADSSTPKRLARNSSKVDHAALYRNKSSLCKHMLSQKICLRPAGIAISPWNGNAYISGSDSCKIFICDTSGKRLGSFGSRGHEDGELLCPTSLAFSRISNELFIADKWKHCIHVFDCDGHFTRRIGMKGRSHGKFCSPEGVCTDKRGNIYVADTCNYRVQVLDNDGVFIRDIGRSSNLTIQQSVFMEPAGVAATEDGSMVYVADCGSHRIKVFNGHTGESLFMFGSRGHNRGEFESPECITIDENGFVLVGDSGNGRIQVFKPNGSFVRCLGAKNNNEPGEIGWISGIAVNADKDIFVTEFKNSTISVY